MEGDCIPCQKATNTLKKAVNIINGYKNLIVKDDKIEELSKSRMEYCNVCPNKNVMVKVGDIIYYSCELCNCPLIAKTRSENETCPLKIW